MPHRRDHDSGNLFSAFEAVAHRHPERQSIGFFKDDRLEYWTYRELLDHILSVSEGLKSLGFRKGDRLAILAPNSVEWVVMDFAALRLGMITIPIHTTLSGNQVQEILNLSKAKAVALGRGGSLESYQNLCSLFPSLNKLMPRALRCDIPNVKRLIFLHDESAKGTGRRIALPLSELLESRRNGHRRPPVSIKSAGPEDIACILYTSGTTGNMKGVLLTHGNILSNILASIPATTASQNDLHLVVLPLSHAFERTSGLLMHLLMGATVVIGRGPAALLQDLQIVHPTVIAAVPRLLEKVSEGLRNQLAKKSSMGLRFFDFGLRRTRLYRQWKEEKNSLAPLLYLQAHLADRVFYRKIRDALGGRLRKIVCGGAALDPHIADFFSDIGIHIQEGYGLTEHSPTVAVNPLHRPKRGSVGKALPHVELRIGKDDEVLVRSGSVMKGYENQIAETRRVIDAEGWLHTGDQGEIDKDGYLFLRGRLKEMLVTSNGKNVYPTPLEQAIQKSPLIKQLIVIGDHRPYLSALVVPERDHLEALLYAEKKDILNWKALCEKSETKALIASEIRRFSNAFAQHERIKDFAIIPDDFNEANGFLTPTLKLRRSKIERHYHGAIEDLYKK